MQSVSKYGSSFIHKYEHTYTFLFIINMRAMFSCKHKNEKVRIGTMRRYKTVAIKMAKTYYMFEIISG